MKIKSRHHLRADAVSAIREVLHAQLDVELPDASFELVEFDDLEYDVVLIDGSPAVFYIEGDESFLTVRGANEYEPTSHIVTVDAGAIPFLTDGADVMRPGIVDADADIEAGDLVAINEENHGKFLAIGRSRVDGDELLGESGKVIDTIHHVGDELYNWSA